MFLIAGTAVVLVSAFGALQRDVRGYRLVGGEERGTYILVSSSKVKGATSQKGAPPAVPPNAKTQRSASALPLHVQAGQTSEVEPRIAVPVRNLSAREYIRTLLNSLQRESEPLRNASTRLIAG